jgi:hypothetical protein
MAIIANSTDTFKIAVGTTAQRPGTPAVGMIRINTSTNSFEIYDGTSWGTIKAF